MSTTSDFLKLRSNSNPKLGEWNLDYKTALSLAKKNYKFIITCWSNGDSCAYCKAAEICMMDKVFTDWMKTSDAYFVFQYSGDPDEGKVVHDWVYNKTGLKYYPGFRITLYDTNGKILVDQSVDGNTMRNKKTKTKGATEMVSYLSKILAKKPAKIPSSDQDYKIRLNEKLTVKKINAILDAIDKNEGYCPCQPKSKDSKCHCVDFTKNKKVGEPCICNIYVKQKK